MAFSLCAPRHAELGTFPGPAERIQPWLGTACLGPGDRRVEDTFAVPGATEETPALWHTFDTGSAWGHLALQASLSGWHTHGMAGFDQELTRKELKIPEGYALHAAVAIGKLGDKSTLADYLQARETPSPRRPLNELVSEGDFNHQD